MVTMLDRLQNVFGEDAFDWLDRSYIVDWSVATVAWFIAWIVSGLPPYEREFDRKDTLIDHKHHKSQIGGDLNWFIAFVVPFAVIGVISCLRRSALDLHHGALALYATRAFSEVATEVLKNRVGRLRPDFLSRCKWDKELKACAGDLETILDGRRSFPSGHSSTAFSGMMFLSLWLAGITGAWCITRPAAARSFLASRLARLSLSCLPLAFATWVAVSRVEDYRHHKEDVIVGGLLGTACAVICYLTYWPNPFAHHSRLPSTPKPSTRTAARRTRKRKGYQYELAGMEHANGVESV
ncbi:phosphatidic acid phosphatase type 2/haloperoxidase [Fomitopsis serialis]|uniref:phosphatidic acid phosphatase type 2/haloperoxidase n=1 Tax=Fomitopsis serialis TaxID=139415 RepID=UPI0020084F87|nr:phosphatidic acid phosphatase type 2/haloperoxidase [Neoantrodia serialis]KAH9930322.1 phosphatidic acid phosphatase type 2/haloperoxidase [Neoantrodia serialis]